MKRLLMVALLLLLTRPSYAFLELKSEFFSSFRGGNGNDLMFSSYNGLYLNGPGFAMGAAFLYEPLHDYVTDTGFGGAIRFGEVTTVELGAGYFVRDYDGLKGKGFWGGVILGWFFHPNIGITLPIIAKKISSGDLDKRLLLEATPHIALRFRI